MYIGRGSYISPMRSWLVFMWVTYIPVQAKFKSENLGFSGPRVKDPKQDDLVNRETAL